MKEDIVMLSIDSSTKKTGIAIFVNGKYKENILINLEEIKLMDERFAKMSLELIKTLNVYTPKIIYIEETVVVRNPSTQRFLTRLQGVIYGWAIINDCEFTTVRPTEWRKNVKRDQLKEEAISYIKEIFNIDVNDDEAEAVCIGLYALKLFDISY